MSTFMAFEARGCRRTMFKNHPKCRIRFSDFGIFRQFLSNKTNLSGNTVWPQVSDFQKLAKSTIFFGIFNELFSTQNVTVARFARNLEWDFSCDFQTPWLLVSALRINEHSRISRWDKHLKLDFLFCLKEFLNNATTGWSTRSRMIE